MKFAELRPFVRFCDTVSYSVVRLPSMTYDTRLLYVTEGSAAFMLGTDAPRTVEKGAVILFGGRVTYSIRPTPSFVAVAVDFDFTDEYRAMEAVIPPVSPEQFDIASLHRTDWIEDAQILNAPVILEEEFSLRDEFLEIVKEFRRGELFYRERCGALLLSILAKIARRGVATEKRAETFRRIVGYIQDHPADQTSNTHIARALGYDPCYLNRIVLFSTGLSLHQYVIKYRIDKAVALLLSTDMSVEEVALSLGFYSSAHFSNQCLRHTGHRPSFYKNKTEG